MDELRERVTPLRSLNASQGGSSPSWVFAFSQAKHLALFPPWLICLRTFPWGVRAYLSQDGSQSEGFWEEQDSLWPGIILWLWVQGALLGRWCCGSVSQSCPTAYNPWIAAGQASLSFTISQIVLKPMSIESVMPSNHIILCHPLLLLPSIFPSIGVFSNESALRIMWPKYWGFSFSISPGQV